MIMRVIPANGVNEAYNEALWLMKIAGKPGNSRNGKVLRLDGPVTTCYTRPRERVLFDPKRDANPYFHLMEAMWMLAGRNDVKSIARYNSQIGQFSDDGDTLRGAYGHRWRNWFKRDQLIWAIEHLRSNPDSRRCVIQMWDADGDADAIDSDTKDVSCNTQIYFLKRPNGLLDMTVTNRSNDIIWGCYGANMVHMSFLHEFVAQSVGCDMGTYYQMSNDWHIYSEHFPLLETLDNGWNGPEYTPNSEIQPRPLLYGEDLDDPYGFLDKLNSWFDCRYWEKSKVSWINQVMNPMDVSWIHHREGDREGALANAHKIASSDWSKACVEWLQRRYTK